MFANGGLDYCACFMKAWKHASMKSLIVCSRWAAATLMAFTSSRGRRTCNGTIWTAAFADLDAPRGFVAAAGVVLAFGDRASGVSATGLGIEHLPHLSLACLHETMLSCFAIGQQFRRLQAL
jgi:hypothetical protein